MVRVIIKVMTKTSRPTAIEKPPQA